MKKVLDSGAARHGLQRALLLGGLLLALLSSPGIPAAPFAPTHGADPMPTLLALASPAAPACREAPGEPAFRVVYALPPSTLDLFDAREPAIRAGIALATGIVLESSLPHGVDVRLRFVCEVEGKVDIARVRLQTPPVRATFATVTEELRELGFSRSDEKYWVLYEGYRAGCGSCAGQANVWSDDRPGVENLNNRGAMFAVTYVASFGLQAEAAPLGNVMLHEASHTMGAVQLSAPHSTGGFHCNDGADIMCYADGSAGSAYDRAVCPRLLVTHVGPEMPYDCGGDDYFHPAAAEGSYLATRWNVGAPANLWTQWRRV